MYYYKKKIQESPVLYVYESRDIPTTDDNMLEIPQEEFDSYIAKQRELENKECFEN